MIVFLWLLSARWRRKLLTDGHHAILRQVAMAAIRDQGSLHVLSSGWAGIGLF
jgi:hypothetical protein